MKSIFDVCIPRDEVLRGELREDIFAASLKDVIEATADPIYRDPQVFFENTFITSGLKTLLSDAAARLVGDPLGTNAIIRLETAFGGGKTHNLIALYHLMSGKTPEKFIKTIFGKDITGIVPGSVNIAGVVGSDLEPVGGLLHPKTNIRTYSLWGELAYQLGGLEKYKIVQESDEAKAAIGGGQLEEVIGDQPTLIMLDEIARYMRASLAVQTANRQSTLADQTVAFLMSLLEFAVKKPKCMVVITLGSAADAFSDETEELRQDLEKVDQELQIKLAEAHHVSARRERVLTPTTEEEIFSIVTHRLFKSIDQETIDDVCMMYQQYFQQLISQDTELPQRCIKPEYYEDMHRSYPFHPELMVTLNRKVATIPNFNQTRGALRLLAWTVRNLWDKNPADTWLIHPHHVDLSVSQILEDLTSRLDRPSFKKVVEADITSALSGFSSHANSIDAELVQIGRPPYAQRLATAIFIHSLTAGQASGVTKADLMSATLTPHNTPGNDDDPQVLSNYLEKLYNQAWFLEFDGHHYRFKTEPSINKIIADEMGMVPKTKAKIEIENRIRQIWQSGYFKPVYFPNESSDVDDDAGKPKLTILHFDAVQVTSAQDQLPDLIRRIYEASGNQGAFRRYQNNVLFLAADDNQIDNMIEAAQRYLAIQRIQSDHSRFTAFNQEQRNDIKSKAEQAELMVRLAITRTYKYLYYPSIEASQRNLHLQRETLPPQDQGEVDKDQTSVILRILRASLKVLTADDDPLAAQYVKSRAWEQEQTSMTTLDLQRAFARKVGLKILLDPNQLKKTIDNGIKTGVWIYYDSHENMGYDQNSPPTLWQINEDAILYEKNEATRLNLPIKGQYTAPLVEDDRCPVCGELKSHCTCQLQKRTSRLSSEGATNQAFQHIVDQAEEMKCELIHRLILTVEGSGKDIGEGIVAIGLAIPQMGRLTTRVSLKLVMAFETAHGRDDFHVEFQGNWDRYKRVKNLSDSFLQEANELTAKMVVDFTSVDEAGFNKDDVDRIRQVVSGLYVGRMEIVAIPGQPTGEN